MWPSQKCIVWYQPIYFCFRKWQNLWMIIRREKWINWTMLKLNMWKCRQVCVMIRWFHFGIFEIFPTNFLACFLIFENEIDGKPSFFHLNFCSAIWSSFLVYMTGFPSRKPVYMAGKPVFPAGNHLIKQENWFSQHQKSMNSAL